MAIRMTAKDGTEFGVFNQGNGDYVALIDDRGSHRAPPQHSVLPDWSEAEARLALQRAVRRYEENAAYRAEQRRREEEARRLDQEYFAENGYS